MLVLLIRNRAEEDAFGGRCLKLITLYVPETYLRALDQLVDERFYPNRAEAIRVAIRDLINDELWRRGRVG
jgi:Arc/MetJ-type ribon-helix-helix transcriptional regulator